LVFKARNVSTSLCGKGFQEYSDRDHRYYFFCHGGKRSSIQTKISHNPKEIDDYLCSAMSRQIRLTRSQFRGLVECPLTADGYLKLMIDSKHLTMEGTGS
jgi:hypothetical protein